MVEVAEEYAGGAGFREGGRRPSEQEDYRHLVKDMMSVDLSSLKVRVPLESLDPNLISIHVLINCFSRNEIYYTNVLLLLL